jgi:hypothetical protein
MLVGAHGMTTLQAAAVVGVAEGTIKARVSRARKALRLVMPQGPEGRTDDLAEDAQPPAATRGARNRQALATAGEGADDTGTGGHPIT